MVFQRISVLWLISSFLVGLLLCNKNAASYKVESLPNSYDHLGEGPHWFGETQSLYSVSIEDGVLRRFDYEQEKMYRCQIENEKFASFIIPIEGSTDKFAVGINHRITIVKWDGISETCKVEETILTVEESDKKYSNNRFNDAKCDPLGRLFAGTMRKSDQELRTGNLYKLLKVNSSELLITDVGISNGLTFDEKAKKFYYIDSQDKNVKAFDYDINTGEIKNPKVIFNLREYEEKAVPDGMTIDSEGFLFIADNGGGAVLKVDPKNGEIILKIEIPAEQVTSVAFGGPNMDILYATTSDETSPSGKSQTYKVTGLGSKGLPMTNVRL